MSDNEGQGLRSASFFADLLATAGIARDAAPKHAIFSGQHIASAGSAAQQLPLPPLKPRFLGDSCAHSESEPNKLAVFAQLPRGDCWSRDGHRGGLWLYRLAAGAPGESSSGGSALPLCRHVSPAAARGPCGPSPATSRS